MKKLSKIKGNLLLFQYEVCVLLWDQSGRKIQLLWWNKWKKRFSEYV